MTLNEYGPVFCIDRRNQRQLQLRSFRCRKQQSGWFCVSFWCLKHAAHFHCEVRQYLNTVLPGRWIGRASGNDQSLLLWPPRFPDITTCDFFLWGYFKDRVFVPPLPRDLADLKARIIAAVKNIDAPILTPVWQELEYRIDVCRVTRGARIEYL